MCSACGTSPSGAFASSAARWRTPKRCCSSTTTSARSRNSTVGSISACVPTTSCSWPVASRASRSRRRAGGVEPVSSSTGSAPPSSESSVRWCCSASVSVGAISAAWAPFSTARSIASSATTVLPLPTSPISSRCIGRSSARSASIASMAATWSPVSSNGSDQRQRSTTTPRAASGRAPAPLAPRAPPPGDRQLEQEQLLEGEPAARALLVLLAVGEVRRGQRGRPVRQRLRHPQRRRQRLDRGEHARVGLPHQRAQLRRRDALGGRVHRHEADGVDRRVARSPSELLELRDPELAAAAQLAVQQHLGALAELARDPGLVEPDRHQRPALVEHARLDALAAPVAHRLDGHAAHGDRDGAPPPPPRARPTSRTSRRSRWACGRCSIRSPQVAMPSFSSAFGPSIALRQQARPRVRADRSVVWQRLRGREACRVVSGYSAQSSHHHAGWPPSWYSTSTPAGRARLDVGAVERRLLAGDAGEQLGAVGDLRERVAASVSAGSPHATSSPPA